MIRETSIRTYRDIIDEGIVGERQIKVLEYIAQHPDLTDTEIAVGLGYSDMNKVRPRRKELLDMKMIKDNGKKECSITHRECHHWRLADTMPSKEDLESAEKTVQCPACHGSGKIKEAEYL